VEAVHAVGGRVAVHSQQAAGGAAAIKERVDSLEHGMCLTPGTSRSKNLHLTSHSQRHQKTLRTA
jgi:imidazolonepropionase-like amidohydrolase